MGETLQLSLTEWTILEEHGCLGAVPPRLFVLECLGCMKSLLFLLKATVAHRRIKSSKQGMAYERIAITSFQNIFWAKRATRSEVYLRVQFFGQRQHRFDPQGLSHYASCQCQAQEQCHTSLTSTQCCRQSWALCVEEEISKSREELFSITPTAGACRGC